MADLIAQGADPRNRWRRALLADRQVVLGRAGTWPAPWDDRISRRHVELHWDGQRLHVRRLSEARNPVFYKGKPCDGFELRAGEHFVIGDTTFTVASDRAHVSLNVPAPLEELAFSTEYLHNVPFRRVGPHIDVLSRLPEVIGDANSDVELSVRLVNLLLTGLPRAEAAALVAARGMTSEMPRVDVLHWDRRATAAVEFQPSQRLITDALRRNESVLHVWNAASAAKSSSEFTAIQDIDWAFSTPVMGRTCRGWAFYVAGKFMASNAGNPVSDPRDLCDDLKFTELAATTLGALCDVRRLERERAALSHFFAPPVLEALQDVDPDVALAPRETEVTVLFCDLRGFSRVSERSADNLMGLLQRVSQSLGVATHAIRAEGGVVGDFHGDAAMGFWGWPLPQGDAVLRAARAALAIRASFEAAVEQDSPLADFQVGIGLSTGRAVAGKIGTADQVKVTVFGPVVNLASRLEGMTKLLHAPILIDERTAVSLRAAGSDAIRLRRVAIVRPAGMDTQVEVTELLPRQPGADTPSDQQIADYEQALDEFNAGDWHTALERLHGLPARDRVKDFLVALITRCEQKPPDNWRGVITLTAK